MKRDFSAKLRQSGGGYPVGVYTGREKGRGCPQKYGKNQKRLTGIQTSGCSAGKKWQKPHKIKVLHFSGEGVTPEARRCYTYQKGQKMGSKTTRVISVRISNEAAAAIELEADRTGKSVKELIETFGLDISGGRIRCNTDSVMPTDDYLEDIGDDGEYERLGFSGVLHRMREKGYPDDAIRRMNEQNMIQISDMPKWSARRAGNDWGC